MVIKNKIKIAFYSSLFCFAHCYSAVSANIDMNTAQMQALDKVTGQMSIINVPVGGEAKFGSFSVVVRSCQTTPPEDVPENYAFVDVADTDKEGKISNIFKGWMVSSSPSLNSVEHPVYDVWLPKCINNNEHKNLLTQQQLDERDNVKKLSADTLSKEAQIAIERQEELAKKEEQQRLEREAQERLSTEEKENQNRLNEINNELANANQLVVVPSLPQDDTDNEGPVALFNINQVPTVKENPVVENFTEENNMHTEGIVDIAPIPNDIDEVMPQIQSD